MAEEWLSEGKFLKHSKLNGFGGDGTVLSVGARGGGVSGDISGPQGAGSSEILLWVRPPSPPSKGYHSCPLTLAGSLYIPAHIPPLAWPPDQGAWVLVARRQPGGTQERKFNTGPQPAVSLHIMKKCFSASPGWRQGL